MERCVALSANTLFVSPQLERVTVTIPTTEQLRRSIILSLSWLQKNVLFNNAIDSLSLKNRLRGNCRIDSDFNHYLINECLRFRSKIEHELIGEQPSQEMIDSYRLLVTECADDQILLLGAINHNGHLDLVKL